VQTDEYDRPVLDAQVVARLERLGAAAGQDLFGQLAVLFLADADTWLGSLRSAVSRNDSSGIANAAHTLGGAGANVGATELARLCSRLSAKDALAAPGALAGARAVLDLVEAELTRVRAVLDLPVLTS
jgi:HPt (histidine-containing phosphotransfer) domain-containing protein